MNRSASTAMLGSAVLAALAGCATQDTFSLPGLTPYGAQPTVQVYANSGTGYGYGHGYPSSYRPGLGYGYADPYYAAQGPYPYAYGYGYGYGYGNNPYPRYVVLPCPDNNRNGRCDKQAPKDRDHHGDNGSQVVTPSVQPQAVPAPAPMVQQPARVRPESRRALPSDATAPRGPRGGGGRPSRTRDDDPPSRPAQEP